MSGNNAPAQPTYLGGRMDLRDGFESLTRDGFLVIRNELANDGNPVNLFRGDPDPRARRIDEIMFFARGDFASVRRPMSPGRSARANEARVWLGMGQRAVEDLADLEIGSYLYPSLDDTNIDLDAGLGRVAMTAGVENPNRFASDWTLLRHITLLTPLASGEPRTTSEMVFDLDPFTEGGRRRLRDQEWQIGMQPAAQSVFRARMDHWVMTANGIAQFPRPPQLFRNGDHAVWPRFSSGLVDVASESMAEIRSMVTSSPVSPMIAETTGNYTFPVGSFDPLNVARSDVMRAWMLNALPGEFLDDVGQDLIHPQTLSRMRYEPTPPLLGIPDSEVSNDRERAYREADQEMLSASAFIPRCTEFIVEWSFGWTFNSPGDPRFGQIQWYGLNRAEEDANDDGDLDDPIDRSAHFFHQSAVGTLADGSARQGLARISQLVNARPVNGPLVANQVFQESVFGYYDPGTNLDSPDDDAEWPWPTLIRITMSFADPNDPTIETTTQFVVEVPGGE